MSNERIDLKHYENKYTFETPIDPNWNGAPWTKADLKVILGELKRCYEMIDQAKANLEELYEVTQSSEVQSIAHYLEGKASE
tara:strand:- start:197 stop:442 length:246 start_codon:yes stop_codon:yes gene_type:complete